MIQGLYFGEKLEANHNRVLKGCEKKGQDTSYLTGECDQLAYSLNNCYQERNEISLS